MKNTLEGSKWFAVVAWTAVFTIAFLTFQLISDMKNAVFEAELASIHIEKAIDANPNDFEYSQ